MLHAVTRPYYNYTFKHDVAHLPTSSHHPVLYVDCASSRLSGIPLAPGEYRMERGLGHPLVCVREYSSTRATNYLCTCGDYQCRSRYSVRRGIHRPYR